MTDELRTPVKSALDLIGNTPMVELTRFETGPCRLFVKLESQNPGGSIKDRIGKSMIEAAEKDGRLKPGRPANNTPKPRGLAGDTALPL